jgi:hypothetical protein
MKRYMVVVGSQSGHAYFGATVVDTTKPQMINGKLEFQSICECFDTLDAEKIALALNKLEP